MTLTKVFDRMEIPTYIQEKFMDAYEASYGEPPTNESYISYSINSDYGTDKDVTEWLLSNGAEKNDDILIRWWW
jgi:hypothetical protein